MSEVMVMSKRTIKLYLKNPLALLFSFVYMLLFIFLISLFLGDYLAQGMAEVYGEVVGFQPEFIRWLVDSTAMAGVVMINCVLVPLNVLTIMVEDSDNNRLDSFLVSGARRENLVFGYWLAPFVIGVMMNSLGFFLTEAVIVFNGGQWFSVMTNLEMLGLIVLNMFASTSILFLAALLIKKVNLFSTFSGMLSALVGFVTGAFIPIGVFPKHFQMLFALIPAHHGATLMRQVMTKEPLQAVFGQVVDQEIKGSFMTQKEILAIYSRENGITYYFGQEQVPSWLMIGIVFFSGLLFAMISVSWMKKRKH